MEAYITRWDAAGGGEGGKEMSGGKNTGQCSIAKCPMMNEDSDYLERPGDHWVAPYHLWWLILYVHLD